MPLDAEPPNNRSLQRDENLDVVRTSRDQESVEPKGSAAESAPDPLLSVVCPFPAQPARERKHRGRYRPRGSKYISVPQATNLIEAVKFAKSIGLPLVAHLTIHWSGTVAWDDPDGTRFAKVREGLAKVLNRRGIPVAWVWCRECKNHTDIVHSHLLFHLPAEYRFGRKLAEMEVPLERSSRSPRWRHLERVCGEAESLARSRRPLSAQRRWPRSMEAVSHQEEIARGARHHPREAMRHLAGPRSSSTAASTNAGNRLKSCNNRAISAIR